MTLSEPELEVMLIHAWRKGYMCHVRLSQEPLTFPPIVDPSEVMAADVKQVVEDNAQRKARLRALIEEHEREDR